MSILGPDPRTTSAAADGHSLTQHSPAAAKIALFRSLFRGREDTVLDAALRALSRRRT